MKYLNIEEQNSENLNELEQKIFKTLQEDNFTENDAMEKIRTLKQSYARVNEYTFSKRQLYYTTLRYFLESLVFANEGELDNEVFETFEIAIDALHDESYALKSVLRFMNLFNQQDANKLMKIIDKNLKSSLGGPSYILSLYFDKVVTYSESNEMIENIFSKIKTGYPNLGTLLTAVKVSELPEQNREEVREWIGPEAEIITSNKIVSIRHIDGRVGSCEDMQEYHKEDFLLPDDISYGNAALIYVDNQLIGSFKGDGQPSILALQTVENNGMYPIIRGGFYATDRDIIHKSRQALKQKGNRKFIKLHLDELPVYSLEQWTPYDLDKTKELSQKIGEMLASKSFQEIVSIAPTYQNSQK